MARVPQDKINKIVEAIVTGVSKDIGVLAEKFNISKSDANNILHVVKSRDIGPNLDLELLKYKVALRESKRRHKKALERLAEIQLELEHYHQFNELQKVLVPVDMEMKVKESKEVVPFVLASDWHIDEVVDPDSIGGVNEFNQEIARKRIKAFFNYVVKLVLMCRKESPIHRLVIAALGDFYSGWIHEELKISNTMSPPEALIELYELWLGGLHLLLTATEVDEIIFVGVCGNHTRITDRPQAKQQHKKSYEWALYELLARSFAVQNETRIKFKLPTGYFNRLSVFGKELRFHHGDKIRYHGGVGGIHIPLRKAIGQWNKAKRADLDVLAHWHTRENSRDYVINGSLIGYSEFSEFIKADFEPPQQSFFLLHPSFGKTGEFPIVLD